MRLKNVISILGFFLLVNSLPAQNFNFTGIIYSAADSTPIPFAYVINTTALDGVNTDEQGKFSLAVHPSDSILISALGYERTALLIPAEIKNLEPVKIYLIPAPYQIDTVVVRAMPTKELFPWAFKNLELAEEKNPINLNIPEDLSSLNIPLEANETRVHAPNEILSGGIIIIPIGRSPDFKIQREKSELSRQKNMLEAIDRKYSNEFISRITEIKQEEEIIELKKFCNLSNDFILQKTEYEIALAVLDCFKGFEKRN